MDISHYTTILPIGFVILLEIVLKVLVILLSKLSLIESKCPSLSSYLAVSIVTLIILIWVNRSACFP